MTPAVGSQSLSPHTSSCDWSPIEHIRTSQFAFILALTFAGSVASAAQPPGEGEKEFSTSGRRRSWVMLGTERVSLGTAAGEGFYRLETTKKSRKSIDGKEDRVSVIRRLFYPATSKRIALVESAVIGEMESQGTLQLFDADGARIFEKDLKAENGSHRDFESVHALGTHHVAAITIGYPIRGRKLEVYDSTGEIVFSTPFSHACNFYIPPTENYILLSMRSPNQRHSDFYKYDFHEIKKIASGDSLSWKCFSNDGKSYLLSAAKKAQENASPSDLFRDTNLILFSADTKQWEHSIRYELGGGAVFSNSGKYLIFRHLTDIKRDGHKILASTNAHFIFNVSDGKLIAEGKLSPQRINAYMNEEIDTGDAP